MISIICWAWAIVFLVPFIEETVRFLQHYSRQQFSTKKYLIAMLCIEGRVWCDLLSARPGAIQLYKQPSQWNAICFNVNMGLLQYFQSLYTVYIYTSLDHHYYISIEKR